MHIAVVIQDFPPETGAGPARVAEMARTWIEAGHHVSVVTALPSRRIPGQRDGIVPQAYRGRMLLREQWSGMHVYRSWLYASPRRGFLPTLLNHFTFAVTSCVHGLARLRGPDVVIASGPPYFAQFSGAAIAAARGVPLVLDIRDLWPDYLAEMGVIRSAWLTSMMFGSERWLLRQARAVVVVTESFRERLRQKGVPAASLTVIPNGVDGTRYRPSADEPPLPELERREPGEAIVGYLGTFGAGQGLEAVIDAAAQLRARGRRVRFVLAGDGPERQRLEQRLRASPVEGLSLHTPIPRAATPAFYNACDAVLVPHAALPVLGATVPSKLFEVMACGRPLVAALCGEGAAVVERSGAGVTALPGDATSIAQAIEYVLSLCAEQRRAFGEAGRAYALAHYDRRVLAQRYLSVLAQAVAA